MIILPLLPTLLSSLKSHPSWYRDSAVGVLLPALLLLPWMLLLLSTTPVVVVDHGHHGLMLTEDPRGRLGIDELEGQKLLSIVG